MFSSPGLRKLLSAGFAAALLFGASACSSSSDDADSDDRSIEELGGVDDSGDDAGTDGDDAGTDGGDAGDGEDAGDGASDGGRVTADHGPARATVTIDDIDDACEWIDVSEVEQITGSSGLSADGFGVPGFDVMCEYEDEAGQVWVQMTYKQPEPDLDLGTEFSDNPVIEWIEELDGFGEQAVVLEGPMGSAQVDVVDGDLRVMANVILGGDAERSQQAVFDLAARGMRAE